MDGQKRKIKRDMKIKRTKDRRLLVVLSLIVTDGSDWRSFGSSKLAFHKATTVRGRASCSFNYML